MSLSSLYSSSQVRFCKMKYASSDFIFSQENLYLVFISSILLFPSIFWNMWSYISDSGVMVMTMSAAGIHSSFNHGVSVFSRRRALLLLQYRRASSKLNPISRIQLPRDVTWWLNLVRHILTLIQLIIVVNFIPLWLPLQLSRKDWKERWLTLAFLHICNTLKLCIFYCKQTVLL